MAELYETLGVEPDADPAAIKSAHRKAVARLHPDNQDTGDRDGFERAQRAYEILSDPEKRAHYDRTGDTEHKADNEQGQIIAIVVKEFTAACQRASLEHDDICALAIKSIIETCTGMKAQIKAGRDDIKSMEKARERVRRKDGENFIASAMSAMINNTEHAITQIEASKAKHEAAIDLLKSFEYTVDPRPAPTSQFYSQQQHTADAFAYMQEAMKRHGGRSIFDDILRSGPRGTRG